MICGIMRFSIILIVCLTLVSWARLEYGESATNSDCLTQKCGEVDVSYPFALTDRPDCPAFSSFFILSCDAASQSIFLPSVWTGIFSTTLLVTNITHDSLIVDITPLNASFPPSPLASNGSCPPRNTTSPTYSFLILPFFPGPFVISDDNEFGSFGCTEGVLVLSKNAAPPTISSAPPSPSPSPSLSPDQQVMHITSPAQAPAPAPSTDQDVPFVDAGNFVNVNLGGCVVICPDDVGNSSLCGHGRNCCVTGLPENSAPEWRYAVFDVIQSPLGSSMSCKGGTNYATLFHRNSSDLDQGIYRLKLIWALPFNYTNSHITELISHSPEYNCSSNANFTLVDGVPGYRCSCNPGYMGDGYLKGSGCTDINECVDGSDDCVSTSKCENSPPGSYTCKCKERFHVGDGRTKGSGCQFSHRWRLGIQISAAFVLLGLMMGGVFCLGIWWRERTKKQYFMKHGGLELQEILRSRPGRGETRIFKEEELKSATSNYADHMKLGAGGFGTVFKGVLEDGMVVAVKKPNMIRKGDGDDREQFLNEMAILVQINHRHIVRLLGCCLETAVPMLVYEFISNGNLEQNLEGNSGTVVMGWEQRLQVARQLADALAYLHAAASPPILHLDVKSANVLLDENLDAKVADFGLSRIVINGVEEADTALKGTLGYVDPECFQTLELTDKSDVYSLGVVLVEIITGRKPRKYIAERGSFVNLAVFFIHHMNEGKLNELIDARLNVNPSTDEETQSSIMAVAALAGRCLDLQGCRRPSMSHVADRLHQIVQALRSGSSEDEDENEPLISSKETSELIEYEEAGAIMPADNPQPQGSRIQSGSVQNLLINTPTSPR